MSLIAAIDKSIWNQVVAPEQSNIGAAVYVNKNGSFIAVCGACVRQLGWTWGYEVGNDSGFWSCKFGCKKVYNNPLKSQTSSIRHPYDGRDITAWVAGWLGVPREDVTVEVVA